MDLGKEKEYYYLIKNNEGLLHRALRKWKLRDDFDDLLQEARIALIYAYDSYNPKRKTSWGSYAVCVIVNRIKQVIFNPENRKKRVPYDKSIGIHLIEENEEQLPDRRTFEYISNNPDFSDTVIYNDIMRFVNTKLSKKKADIYTRYMNGFYQKEIAADYHISTQRIQQIILEIKQEIKREFDI